jgi:hypothetical protein
MSTTRDWLPRGRDAHLAMAKKWLLILNNKGPAWNVPDADIQELTSRTNLADAVLTLAKNEATRTPVTTARCREAFDALAVTMRDIKRRYFFVPPLDDSDFIALGLTPHDAVKTPSGNPTAQVTVETFLIGRHELGVRIVYVSGNSGDPANKGYRIWYQTVPPGGDAPENPEQLTKSFLTQRKKDVISFDYGDSGKTAYIAVQIENDGKKGTWGPMVSAVIP